LSAIISGVPGGVVSECVSIRWIREHLVSVRKTIGCWRQFSQVEQLPQSQRKQIVQILDAFLEREKLKKAS
jgi:hypothetical protein